MRSRMLAAGIVMLGCAASLPAQERGISAFDLPLAPPTECDPPSSLPPLLQVPPPGSPQPPCLRGPSGEYDPGYFYLPERAPERTRPNSCGPDGRFWIGADLELAWIKPAQTPALVRVGSLSGPVAYGGQLPSLFTAGLSLNTGFWLNQERTHGIDGSFYWLPSAGTNTTFFSNGQTFLLPTGNGGSFPLADATHAGAYQAGFNTRFTSADVNYRENVLCTPDGRLDALVGYRYGHVGDEGGIYGKRLGPDGEIVRFRDDITATNNFHGGQIGLAGEYRLDKWFISGSAKVAFGAVFTDTDLEGKFRVNTVVVPIGFYSRPGVDGPRSFSNFAVMPVVGLTLGRQLSEHWRAFVGYNFLYLNNVTRGPDVLDPTPTVLASNPQAPIAATTVRRDSTTSDFWVQSVTFGVEWRH